MENFFALIIGVGGDLPATTADAIAIYTIFSDPENGGYLPENIVLLVEKDATKEHIMSALDKLILKSKSQNNSTVIIYYSGHGLQVPDVDSASDFIYYLKTSGFDPDQKEKTMLNGSLFSEKINRIKAEKLLVLLDCCHADGIKKNKISEFEDMMVVEKNSNRGLLAQLNSGEGRVFISACDDHEESVILPGSTNSLFTEVCLEVFEGKLSPSEEFVSVIDLIYFVVKEVPKRLQPFRHTQRPIITEVQNLSPDYFICRNGNYNPINKELEDFLIDDTPERLDFIKNYENKI